MLRIETQTGPHPTIKAAGRLVGPWVEELADVLRSRSFDQPVDLDLTEVSFADAAGVALLRSLQTDPSLHLRCSAVVIAQLA